MKTTLVNHSGIVQDKFLIKTEEELLEYHRISSRKFGRIAIGINKDENRILEMIKETSATNKEPIIISAERLANEVTQAMLKSIRKGQTVVVNMAGGWMPWNDTEMKLASESERPTDEAQPENLPQVNIGPNKVLVIENDIKIPSKVTDFIKNSLKQDSYSSLLNIYLDHNNQIGEWITTAISQGCDTIVFETQAVNVTQVQKFIELFTALPPMNFYIFSISDIKKIIVNIIGQEKADQLFDKHNIFLYEH